MTKDELADGILDAWNLHDAMAAEYKHDIKHDGGSLVESRGYHRGLDPVIVLTAEGVVDSVYPDDIKAMQALRDGKIRHVSFVGRDEDGMWGLDFSAAGMMDCGKSFSTRHGALAFECSMIRERGMPGVTE